MRFNFLKLDFEVEVPPEKRIAAQVVEPPGPGSTQQHHIRIVPRWPVVCCLPAHPRHAVEVAVAEVGEDVQQHLGRQTPQRGPLHLQDHRSIRNLKPHLSRSTIITGGAQPTLLQVWDTALLAGQLEARR